MRSLLITAAVVAAVLALGSCQYKRAQSVPGHRAAPASGGSGSNYRGASEISWFQGTLEEAFSRHGCPGHGSLFRS
jgi:hypothetical protein